MQGRHRDQASDALGAAGSQVGPVAHGWAVWLHYGLGLSFGKWATLLARLGIEVTAGALSQAAQATGTDLVPVQADLVKQANDAGMDAWMVVMDEAGRRVGGDSAWLWVATDQAVTTYDVADGRGFAQACDLIDAGYTGTIVRDGWAPYRGDGDATHQPCLAHLLRRCHELRTDLPGWATSTPRIVGDLLKEAPDARDLDDTEVAADLTERVELLAEQPQPHDECRKLVAHLANEASGLFRFLADPRVDATTWRAEQAIRPAVVNRKVWGGNRTWRGAATQGRILTPYPPPSRTASTPSTTSPRSPGPRTPQRPPAPTLTPGFAQLSHSPKSTQRAPLSKYAFSRRGATASARCDHLLRTLR